MSMYANIEVFLHIDVCVMFSRGQILLEIHDAIAMRTQTWVGKNVMLSRGQIQFNIHNAIAMLTQIWVGNNSQCFHEVSLGPIVVPLCCAVVVLAADQGTSKLRTSELEDQEIGI